MSRTSPLEPRAQNSMERCCQRRCKAIRTRQTAYTTSPESWAPRPRRKRKLQHKSTLRVRRAPATTGRGLHRYVRQSYSNPLVNLCTWAAGTANWRTDTNSKSTKRLTTPRSSHRVRGYMDPIPIARLGRRHLTRTMSFLFFHSTKIPSSRYHNSPAAHARYLCC
jgi:hypothetical protein